nr:MAG TPA: hypothetical protein [Caudoviricetes sp.]
MQSIIQALFFVALIISVCALISSIFVLMMI